MTDISELHRIDTGSTASSLNYKPLDTNRAGELEGLDNKESFASTEVSYDVSSVPVPHFITQTDGKGEQIAADTDDIETIGPISSNSCCNGVWDFICCSKIEQIYLSSLSSPLLPPVSAKNSGKPCLVLDLDETLVHSAFGQVAGADFKLELSLDNKPFSIFVIRRPGVEKFLTDLSQHYELVLFTASVSQYARSVVDVIDKGKVFDHLLFREHCTYYQGAFVKDLRKLNRPLEKTIIVDNSSLCYQWQPNNAIGISSFINDKTDRELLYCKEFLIKYSNVKDFRTVLHTYSAFVSKRYKEDFGSGELSSYRQKTLSHDLDIEEEKHTL